MLRIGMEFSDDFFLRQRFACATAHMWLAVFKHRSGCQRHLHMVGIVARIFISGVNSVVDFGSEGLEVRLEHLAVVELQQSGIIFLST